MQNLNYIQKLLKFAREISEVKREGLTGIAKEHIALARGFLISELAGTEARKESNLDEIVALLKADKIIEAAVDNPKYMEVV